jgi:hypothetical protein
MTQTKPLEKIGTQPPFPNTAERAAEDAFLGVPNKQQSETLEVLTALYYALLGPQTFLEQITPDIRPPLPTGTRPSPSSTMNTNGS